MNTTHASTAAASQDRVTARAPLGPQLRSRLHLEFLQYVRRRDALFFTFLLPPMLLVLFASVFGDDIAGTGVSFAQYFLAGIVGTIGLNVGFGTLAGSITVDRESTALHRLGATPMSPWTYVFAKVVVLVGSSVAQLAILVALGVAAFGLALPDLAGWFTVAWVLTLSVAAFAFVGVAFSALIRDVESTNALVSPVVIVLPFISGVYFEFGDLPGWMQTLGSAFPLRWATLGMRSAFLPDSFAVLEPGGSWQLGTVAVALTIWTVVGALLARRVFRWGDAGR